MSANLNRRTRVTDRILRDTGPYEAIIVNHLDPLNMGTLEVEIIRYHESSGTPRRSGQLVSVRYLSPFYGVTPNRGLTPNDGFQFTQKSYGMWMIPPDVGTRVLVLFAEGSTAYGYWIGCIQDAAMNFMVPGAGQASTELTTENTPSNLKGTKLPVGEPNKLYEDASKSKVDPTLFEKPYNKDFTEVLEVQGLILDEARGTTTSSARRETPSMVFGISTPGPLDKRNGSPKAQYGDAQGAANIPYNRLGGTSFVMDDGNDKYIRATHAADGPPVYLNREAGEIGGDETILQNELVRLRTRTGHQILMHNSEDMIYIGNSRGTAWIELTSDGKIDIYARDSVSVYTDNDLNLSSGRDVNIDAGRNVNIKATARFSDGRPTTNEKESGRIQIESAFNTNIDVGKRYRLTVKDISETVVDREMRVLTKSDYHLHSNQNIYQRSDRSTHESSGASWYRESASNINDLVAGLYLNKNAGTNFSVGGDGKLSFSGSLGVTVGAKTDISSGSSFHVSASGIHLAGGGLLAGDAGEVHWNSGKAVAAGPAAPTPATASTAPDDATRVEPLPLITLPYVVPGASTAVSYESILTRAPQHEPWPHHENMNPYGFKPEETDREQPGVLPLNDRVLTVDTFRKNMSERGTSQFVQSNAYNSGAFTGSTGDGHIGQDTAGSGTTTAPPTISQGGTDGPLGTIRTKTGKTTQVAAVFVPNFQGLINDLEAAGYVITKLGGYSKRRAVGQSSWSVHASGGAIDINWPDQVIGGRPNGFFRPRPPNAPITDMPPNTKEIAKRHGLGWGGAWRSLDDAMHFSIAKHEGGTVEGLRNGIIPAAPADRNPQMGTQKTSDAGGSGPQ